MRDYLSQIIRALDLSWQSFHPNPPLFATAQLNFVYLWLHQIPISLEHPNGDQSVEVVQNT